MIDKQYLELVRKPIAIQNLSKCEEKMAKPSEAYRDTTNEDEPFYATF